MQSYNEMVALFILYVYLSAFIDVAYLLVKIHDSERREKRDLKQQKNTLKGIYIKLNQRLSLIPDNSTNFQPIINLTSQIKVRNCRNNKQ